jgi:hypothetical protein
MLHRSIGQEATMRLLRPTVYALLLTLAPAPALLALTYLMIRCACRAR